MADNPYPGITVLSETIKETAHGAKVKWIAAESDQDRAPEVCPFCRTSDPSKAGLHIYGHGRSHCLLYDIDGSVPVRISLSVQRYRHAECGKTFLEEFAFFHAGSRLTYRMEARLRESFLEYEVQNQVALPEPGKRGSFRRIGREVGLDGGAIMKLYEKQESLFALTDSTDPEPRFIVVAASDGDTDVLQVTDRSSDKSYKIYRKDFARYLRLYPGRYAIACVFRSFLMEEIGTVGKQFPGVSVILSPGTVDAYLSGLFDSEVEKIAAWHDRYEIMGRTTQIYTTQKELLKSAWKSKEADPCGALKPSLSNSRWYDDLKRHNPAETEPTLLKRLYAETYRSFLGQSSEIYVGFMIVKTYRDVWKSANTREELSDLLLKWSLAVPKRSVFAPFAGWIPDHLPLLTDGFDPDGAALPDGSAQDGRPSPGGNLPPESKDAGRMPGKEQDGTEDDFRSDFLEWASGNGPYLPIFSIYPQESTPSWVTGMDEAAMRRIVKERSETPLSVLLATYLREMEEMGRWKYFDYAKVMASYYRKLEDLA